MAKSKKKSTGSRQSGLSKNATWLVLALVVVGFMAFVTEPYWNQGSGGTEYAGQQAMVEDGKKIYAVNCAACHGLNAVGQDPASRMGGQRPDGTYIAPALNGTAHSWHHPPDALFSIIKNGSPAKDSPMRGFGERLDDGQINAVLAYIQSLWPPQILSRYRQMNGG